MQTVSAEFTTRSVANVQVPRTYLEIGWLGGVAVTDVRGYTGWTDETDYLVSHSGTLHIGPLGESLIAAGSVGSCRIELDNTTLRYSPGYSDSPLYRHISEAGGFFGKAVRIWQGFNFGFYDEYVCIFTGIVTGYEPEPEAARVSLTCSDWGARWLQDKRSTILYRDKTEKEWITQVAALAGITALALDEGIYAIPAVWMDDESIVDEIWETAASSGGIAFFDQRGYLNYQNVLHWADATPVLVLSEDSYTDLPTSVDADQLATKITVDWSSRVDAPESVIYRLDKTKRFMPGETQSWVARFDYPVSLLYQPSVAYPYNDFWAMTGGNISALTSCTIVLSETYAQQCRISVTNDATTGMILSKLELRGRTLIGGPTEQETATPATDPLNFERLRSERGNTYTQTLQQGQALANVLAQRCGRVRPLYKARQVAGIPQLELTDCLQINTRQIAGPPGTTFGYVQGIVTEISWEGGPTQGFTQDITVMDMTDLLADGPYFIIGTDTLGAHRKVFF